MQTRHKNTQTDEKPVKKKSTREIHIQTEPVKELPKVMPKAVVKVDKHPIIQTPRKYKPLQSMRKMPANKYESAVLPLKHIQEEEEVKEPTPVEEAEPVQKADGDEPKDEDQVAEDKVAKDEKNEADDENEPVVPQSSDLVDNEEKPEESVTKDSEN